MEQGVLAPPRVVQGVFLRQPPTALVGKASPGQRLYPPRPTRNAEELEALAISPRQWLPPMVAPLSAEAEEAETVATTTPLLPLSTLVLVVSRAPMSQAVEVLRVPTVSRLLLGEPARLVVVGTPRRAGTVAVAVARLPRPRPLAVTAETAALGAAAVAAAVWVKTRASAETAAPEAQASV